MKQILIYKGEALIEDTPCPYIDKNSILVEVAYSAISPGTELKWMAVSGMNLFQRAKKQPENVKKLIRSIKEDGIKKTFSLVQDTLHVKDSTGYSASGIVRKTGANVSEFQVGDLVACAGAGLAVHAEMIAIPKKLAVIVPEGLSLVDASMTTIGSIALQGVRQADPKIGATVVVIGLGLIGQLTAQILKAAGCRVIGIDIDQSRMKTAALTTPHKCLLQSDESTIQEVSTLTSGYGADRTIITASTPSNILIQQALELTRKRGKVVIVGDVGLGLKRELFYKKEISILISCSYGPGRYDPFYEEQGHDYPYAYVRWTENRNMACFLDLLKNGQVNLEPFTSTVFPFKQGQEAFKDAHRHLGVILRYALGEEVERKLKPAIPLITPKKKKVKGVKLAIIGAGKFTKYMHLPNLKRLKDSAEIIGIVSASGVNAKNIAEKYDCLFASSNYMDAITHKDVDVVFIATPHNTHAEIVKKALEADKGVFVEKPLAMTMEELEGISKVVEKTKGFLMVGYNRRFSPAIHHTQKIVSGRTTPLMISYKVNSTKLPKDHWVNTEVGGGRIIGESCHMFDIFNYLVGAEIKSVYAHSISPGKSNLLKTDNFVATCSYNDGSLCNLHYTTMGSSEAGKERIEISCEGKSIIIDDFKSVDVFGSPQKGWASKQIKKGHFEELEAFFNGFMADNLPIPYAQLFSASKISLKVHNLIMSE